jgi:hypothetical protein
MEKVTNCLDCKYHEKGANCKHPKNKDLKFWDRVLDICPYFELKSLNRLIEKRKEENE